MQEMKGWYEVKGEGRWWWSKARMTMRSRVGAWPGKRAASARIVSLSLTTTTSGCVKKPNLLGVRALLLGVSCNLASSEGLYIPRGARDQQVRRTASTPSCAVMSLLKCSHCPLLVHLRRRRFLDLLWPEGQSACKIGSYASRVAPNPRWYHRTQSLSPRCSPHGTTPGDVTEHRTTMPSSPCLSQ